jgi:PAS domain S-box-containing protein
VTLDDETCLRVFHSLHDAYAFVNMNGNVIECNEHFCRLTGYTKEELLKLTNEDLTPTKWHRIETKILEEHVATIGYSPIYEKEYIHRNGSIFPVELRTFLIKKTTGESQGMWTIARDISERKQAEEQLLHAKETAERANHAKGAFLAQISHEIRTVLSGLTGAHELLAVTKLTKKQVGLLKTAVHSLDCLVSLMNSVLDLSKIESGMLRLHNREFNMAETIHEATECHAAKFASRKITFQSSVDEKLNSKLIGDPLRLKQVLNNLLDNAIKFTAEGRVVLEAKEIEHSEKECTVKFTISDTGTGIPEEQLENIFDPFIQAANNTSTKFCGTGLGLSISKQIVKLFGGQIGVESSLGTGSAFHFTAKFKKPNATLS